MRLLLLALAGIVVLALGSCTGSNDSRSLSDCDYLQKVEERTDTFQRGIGKAVAALTGDRSTATSKGDAKKAIQSLDGEIGKIIADLKALKVDGEIGAVNGELIAGLQEFKNRLPDAVGAADAGDFQRIETMLDESSVAFAKSFEGIKLRHPAAMARIGGCQ